MIWDRFRRKPIRFGNLDNDENFVEALYRIVLGRPPDKGGLATHLERLDSGRISREYLVRDFILSPECQRNCLIKYDPFETFFDFETVADAAPFLPYVTEQPFDGVQLCELANPRKWLDETWRKTLLELKEVSHYLYDMHRKSFEIVQTVYGLRKLGALQGNDKILGVGVGHEFLLYWFSNQASQVVGTDLYQGDWTSENAKEGDPSVLDDPDKYAPSFPYHKERLSFLRMDGRELKFGDDYFDLVYSLSSIEHFGGGQGAGRAMSEIGRVLKPGGLACIATELVLNGKTHEENFLPRELLEHVVKPSGMKLVQAPVFEMPKAALENPIMLPGEAEMKPHLVLDEDGVRFTSVLLFLVKPGR